MAGVSRGAGVCAAGGRPGARAEPEWFALLFRRHAASVARYASRRLGPGPAEDIVAETFLAAFRQRGRYDSTRHDARPWLYGIAGHPKAQNYVVGSGNIGIFNATWALMENVVLPLRVRASLYGVLARAPYLRLHGQQGWRRQSAQPARQINNGVASGPITHIRSGQVIANQAVLQFGIVPYAGQVP